MDAHSTDSEVKIPPFLKVEKEVTGDLYYSTYAMTLRLPQEDVSSAKKFSV